MKILFHKRYTTATTEVVFYILLMMQVQVYRLLMSVYILSQSGKNLAILWPGSYIMAPNVGYQITCTCILSLHVLEKNKIKPYQFVYIDHIPIRVYIIPVAVIYSHTVVCLCIYMCM